VPRYTVEIGVTTYHQYVVEAGDLHAAEEIAVNAYEYDDHGPEVVAYTYDSENAPEVTRVWETPAGV
tara:strand:- start:2764 stop:2964 length:201 start_codon:yes stop_codon:yes gene_type:complete